ncbi:MAG: hypothetical protein P4L76_05830 [Beijerinckiaceae bacterium]|nr:hypothetical protein [Beijerinckiaceae bacterium]
MQRSSAREFGKRQPVRRTVPAPKPPLVVPVEQAAVFATIRQELGDVIPAQLREVPRSFSAAILAGLVTGFFLVGLDIGQPVPADAALQPLLERAGIDDIAGRAQPYMIALSLLGGARAAASALLIAHRLLARVGQTSLAAYTLGGAGINLLCADLFFAVGGIPPRHGWPVEIAAGAAAGLFYRLFAGTKRIDREDLSRASG